MNIRPKNMPSSTGVYMFIKKKHILYIGKAQNLKSRLNSYFSKTLPDHRKQRMVKEATALKWQETPSEAEALITEAEMIKKYRPAYNVLFRDDKQYFYVCFTKEKFPRVFLTHKRSDDKHQADYIGPFTDGNAIKSTLRMLRHSFPYCTCKEKHKRICQNTSIGVCLGICCVVRREIFTDRKERAEAYKNNIRAMRHILSGKVKQIIFRLKKDMAAYSKKRYYEKAAEHRNKLRALENIFEHKSVIRREHVIYSGKGLWYLQKMVGLSISPHRIEGYDISNIQGKFAVGSMVVFNDGLPDKNEYRRFRIHLPEKPNDTAMIKEIISRRFTHNEWPQADIMVIDGGIAQLRAALSAAPHSKIKIVAIAKREEELYLPDGKIIKLKEAPAPLLHFIQHIRNEAHRFAINYYRKRHQSVFKKI